MIEKEKGLLLDRNSAYNSTLGSIGKISKSGFLQNRLEQQVFQKQAAKFGMSTKRTSMPGVKYLSGGNQQKVVLARALEQEPKILILNEPTAGIDVGGAKEEIYKLLVELASKGMAIVSYFERPLRADGSFSPHPGHEPKASGVLDSARTGEQRFDYRSCCDMSVFF